MAATRSRSLYRRRVQATMWAHHWRRVIGWLQYMQVVTFSKASAWSRFSSSSGTRHSLATLSHGMKLIGTYVVGAMQAAPVIVAQVTPLVTLPTLTFWKIAIYGVAVVAPAQTPG